jgi:hypothetical protein
VIGSTQLDANSFLTEGSLSGEIYPGVERSGTVMFPNKEGKPLPADIKQIDLRLGEFYDTQYKKIELHWVLPLS